jgi:hypothetical protein
MKIRMKPHSGAQGIVVGLLLLASTSLYSGEIPTPFVVVLVILFVAGLALASWGVWSWWSDHRHPETAQ